jgi:hypothetical protein
VLQKLGRRIPLDGPVHGCVGGNEGRNDVEDLVPEAAECVEDSSMSSTGKGALAVRRQSVSRHTLGSRAT